jgi:hypothetical protein
MQHKTKRPHYGMDGHVLPEGQHPRVRKGFPAHLVRKMAMESSEGGRAKCDFCSHFFSANYVYAVRTSWISEAMACRDCIKSKNLQKI